MAPIYNRGIGACEKMAKPKIRKTDFGIFYIAPVSGMAKALWELLSMHGERTAATMIVGVGIPQKRDNVQHHMLANAHPRRKNVSRKQAFRAQQQQMTYHPLNSRFTLAIIFGFLSICMLPRWVGTHALGSFHCPTTHTSDGTVLCLKSFVA